MKEGERLSMQKLWIKRPDIGNFPAKTFNQLVGKLVAKYLTAHVPLQK